VPHTKNSGGRIRRKASIITAMVGMITELKHTDEIIYNGRADIVLLAQEFLRECYSPRIAAQML
jgi:NADPH2 dehydrogenase